jgi:hypothetical protein
MRTTTTTKTTQKYIVNVYEDVEQTVAAGLNNVNISLGNGSSVVQANIASGEITGGNGGHQVLQVSELVMDEEIVDRRTEEIKNGKEEKSTTTTSSTETVIGTSLGGSYTTGSPLIIDFNQDGKVSAEHGDGIDVDGNGTADGCAAGGDKMLAMTDINGNGTIDGSEVFGNETVNPFTGEKLNAANGFEALKMVAEAAKAATGIDCIDKNGLVDLKALNEPFKLKNQTWIVSEENNTTVKTFLKYIIDTKTIRKKHNQEKLT